MAAQRLRVVLFGGVRLSLESECDDWEILHCDDINGLRRLGEGSAPAVLLVDLALLTQSGTTELLKSLGRLHVLPVVFSDASEDLDAEMLLRSGFVGSLQRHTPKETVIQAVRAVAERQLWFSRGTISRLLTTLLFQENLNRFTSREIEILSLIGGGLSNQQIGDKLFISRETVRWHVRGLYSKLGFADRRDAREHLRAFYGSGKRMPAKSVNAKIAKRSLAAS